MARRNFNAFTRDCFPFNFAIFAFDSAEGYVGEYGYGYVVTVGFQREVVAIAIAVLVRLDRPGVLIARIVDKHEISVILSDYFITLAYGNVLPTLKTTQILRHIIRSFVVSDILSKGGIAVNEKEEEKISKIKSICEKYETTSDSDLRVLEKFYLAEEDSAKQMSLLGSLIAYVIPLVLLTVNRLLGDGRDWTAIFIAAAFFLGVFGTLVTATGLHWRAATSLRAVQLVIEERERLAAASQKQPPAEYPLRRRRYVRQ
ncbi:hypothetical protein GXB80_16410 [Paenibacillus polymyxa]|nr:hypothetical protein [Paenibacillus polymyxa]